METLLGQIHETFTIRPLFDYLNMLYTEIGFACKHVVHLILSLPCTLTNTKVGFTSEGRVTSLDLQLYANAGYGQDYSIAVS